MARNNYVADFETTTDPEDCRVWLWSIVEIGSQVPQWGKDMSSFIKHISKRDSVIYFHNLKFDGVFILDVILRSKYKHVDLAVVPGTFQTLIDRMGKYYSIKIAWKNGIVTEFRDSLKKLPFSAKYIAEAFQLPMAKGSIDFKKYRAKGYEPTKAELEYVFTDVLIISEALKVEFEQGMSKLTIGSDSLAEFKRISGPQFNKVFPVLAPHIDSEIRLAYRGGFTYADPRFKGRLQGVGSVYDVNSLYPSVMRFETLPYGTPKFFDGAPEVTKDRPLFITSMTFTATIKPDHIPLIQIKGASMFSETEYVREIIEPVTLGFTNIDLELVFKHYDVEVISYNGYWAFKAMTGIFNDYIDKWSEIKNTTSGALKQIAKLHLNSLYGKFASNPDVTGKYPVLEDDRVKLKLGVENTRDPVYTAMGAFITAYARSKTITAAQLNYARFAYCDTDSLHVIGTEPLEGIEVHDFKLGAWAHEGDFSRAFYIRAKAYMEDMVSGDDAGKLSVHIAGVPVNITEKMTFEDIFDGNVLEGKLTPKTVPGGVVLQSGNFTLKL